MAASTRRRGKVVDFESIGTWKKIDVDPSVFVDESFQGFSGLEELTNFDSEKLNEALHGRKKDKKKKLKSSQKKPSKKKTTVKPKQPVKPPQRKMTGRQLYRELLEKRKRRRSASEESKLDMSAWDEIPVPASVLTALRELGFSKPTPIQEQSLASAIRDRSDIVGGAETGSGKTLAFGIPLLDMILRAGAERDEKKTSDGSNDRSALPNPPPPRLETIDQRMESSEEGSLLDRVDDGSVSEHDDSEDDLSENGAEAGDFPPIGDGEGDEPDKALMALILTPTRELAAQVRNHIQAAAKYTNIKIALVVGGMSMEKQARILKQRPEIVVGTPGRIWELYQQGDIHLQTLPRIKTLVIDEADRMVERRHFEELTEILSILNSSPHKPDRQTMLFSATLALAHTGPTRKVLNWKQRTQEEILGSLMDRIGLKADAKIVDLTQKEGTVSTLMESKIFCSVDQKDYYLFYFLLLYPGRTLVFCNSIDCIRRLQSVLTVLKRAPLPLHSSMHQKQRLKNLDRFTADPSGLLLATDVASRGLDIPDVQHVIHYQVPRTTEIYIHRSGRTARQSKQGLSLLLVSSNEITFYRRVCKTLDKEEIVTFPVDHRYLSEVSARVELAREIDVMNHRFEKKKAKNDWFEQAAKDLEVDLDDRMILEDLGDSHEQKMHRQKLKGLRDEMSFLLKKKIFPAGHSQTYITSSGSLLTPMLKDEAGQQDAVTKLQNDRHFKKDRKRVAARQEDRKRDAEEIGGGETAVVKKAKKMNRNKYHHLGKKAAVKPVT